MSSETNSLTDHAVRYANQLLSELGETARINVGADHPAIAYKRSGLLQTTGLMLPLPLASHADGALLALKALTDHPNRLPENGSVILGERARLRDTVRQGRRCAGGYGRLMDTVDGRIALNLVREDDWDLIPAWLEDYITDWDGIVAAVKTRQKNELSGRAAELGLAVSMDEIPERPERWFVAKEFEKGSVKDRPLIVDLSSLWAGPLASSLLGMIGGRVIKVEGPERPDGMRFGHAGFYHLINGGKACVALDFKATDGLNALKQLLEAADIVIEASRPRAFEQLGIRAPEFVARKPGQVWARITAYGRSENRIGFGDDIGVGSGLSSVMEKAHGEACFVGDAIADPVNGLHVALAIHSFYRRGQGAVLDFSMRDVLRYAMGDIPDDLPDVARQWQKLADADPSPLYPMRNPKGEIHELGEDNQALKELIP